MRKGRDDALEGQTNVTTVGYKATIFTSTDRHNVTLLRRCGRRATVAVQHSQSRISVTDVTGGLAEVLPVASCLAGCEHAEEGRRTSTKAPFSHGPVAIGLGIAVLKDRESPIVRRRVARCFRLTATPLTSGVALLRS